jgi:hypothetical protein
MNHIIDLATEQKTTIGLVAVRISERQDSPGPTSGA